MTKAGLTYIGLITDRSGSMDRIKEDMEGALNAFLDEQKKVPGECLVSLYLFDDQFTTSWEHTPLESAPRVVIQPRAMTALYDAVGKSIIRMGDHFSSMPENERPEKVLVVITTDGLENSSKEFSGERIKDMIKHQEDRYGWAFTYLGANQDAYGVAASMGIAKGSVSNFGASRVGTQTLSANLIGATTRMRRASGQALGNYGYTQEEQDAGDQSVNTP